MNSLTSTISTISQVPCFRGAQQVMVRHPYYTCAIAAIGITAGAAAYYNAQARLLPLQPVVSADFANRALDLVKFYNALPFDQPLLIGNSVIEKAAKAKYWMEHDGNQEIVNCRMLNLSGKRLRTLPSEIALFCNLERLELSNNELRTLPHQIGQLQALRELVISDNQLQILPPEIGQLQALTQLSLSGNQLQILPPEICNLRALEILFFDNNQLQILPPEIGQLQALTQLWLTGNLLQALPPEIGQLHSLRHLWLGANHLQTLPPEIGQLHSLRHLWLGANHLQTLPQEIGLFHNLEELYLDRNQLRTLPTEIGQLQVLRYLFISENQLEDLPDSIINLSSDCYIRAENNRLTDAFLTPFQNRLRDHQLNYPGQGPMIFYSIFDGPINARPETLEANLDRWSQEFEMAFPNNEANAEHFEQRTTNLSPLLTMQLEDVGYLNDFLKEIPKVADYSRAINSSEMKNNVILRVERMIQLACVNAEFKEKMMHIIRTGATSCGDRAQMLLNELEIEWQFYYKELTNGEFTSLAKRAALYDLLENHGKKYAEEHRLGDEIEVILDFHLRLRDPLNLPISTQTMLYRNMSCLDQNPEAIDEAYVIMDSYRQENGRALLAVSKHWKKRLESQNKGAATKIREQFTDMLMQAEEFYNLGVQEKERFLTTLDKKSHLYSILTSSNGYYNASRSINNKMNEELSCLSDNESKNLS